MTQRLNRLVTVAGYPATTVRRLVRWPLADYQVDGVLAVNEFGGWYALNSSGDVLPEPATSTELLSATFLRVNQRLTTIDELPNLPELFVLTFPNRRLLLLGPGESDDTGISFEVVTAQYGTYFDGSRNYDLLLTRPMAGTAAFTITDGRIDLAVEGLTLDTVGEPTTRRVWAQLSEVGGTLGLLVGVAGVTSEGIRQNIEATLRYDDRLRYITALTDDLGRTWDVEAVRASDDRRFVTVEGTRLVSADSDEAVFQGGES